MEGFGVAPGKSEGLEKPPGGLEDLNLLVGML